MAPDPGITLGKLAKILPMGGVFLLLTGCDGWFNLYGIEFPAWMVSLTAGVVMTGFLMRFLYSRSGWRSILPHPALAFTCFATTFSIVVWLVFFRD
jgi:hypothetical protein